MPHVPRRLPPTVGPPPELQTGTQPATRRPAAAREDDEQKRPAQRLGLQKLDPHVYAPDLKKVLKSLLGEGVRIHEATGELIQGEQREE